MLKRLLVLLVFFAAGTVIVQGALRYAAQAAGAPEKVQQDSVESIDAPSDTSVQSSSGAGQPHLSFGV